MVIWVVLVLYASTSAGSARRTGGAMSPFLVWIFPDLTLEGQEMINVGIRKAAHVVQFLVLALLLWRAVRMRPALPVARREVFWWIFWVSLVFALASEGIQITSPHRGASWWDVVINLSGSLLAFGLISIADWFRRKGPILITADLHLDEAPSVIREEIRRAVRQARPSALVVAGDVASADTADSALGLLRDAAGPDLPIVICLGNHDYWTAHPDASLVERRERVWRPACERHRVRCLDFENVEVAGVTICGGYGHYDFGFRSPVTDDQGNAPTDADYRSGRFAGLQWRDADHFPPGTDFLAEAIREAGEMAARLRAIPLGRPVLLVTHTIPIRDLLPSHPSNNLLRFFDAFSGNSLISQGWAERRNDIVLAVSGHTHEPAGPVRFFGIPCLNVGSAPSTVRWIRWDRRTERLERMTFPVGARV